MVPKNERSCFEAVQPLPLGPNLAQLIIITSVTMLIGNTMRQCLMDFIYNLIVEDDDKPSKRVLFLRDNEGSFFNNVEVYDNITRCDCDGVGR